MNTPARVLNHRSEVLAALRAAVACCLGFASCSSPTDSSCATDGGGCEVQSGRQREAAADTPTPLTDGGSDSGSPRPVHDAPDASASDDPDASASDDRPPDGSVSSSPRAVDTTDGTPQSLGATDGTPQSLEPTDVSGISDVTTTDVTSIVGTLDGGTLDGGATSSVPTACALLHGDRFEVVETRCDGVDNDCDGAVDVLMPVEENLCPPRAGKCLTVYAACWKEERVCLPAPSQPEVFDALDNDCNGAVDDVPGLTLSARTLLLVPDYVQEESPGEVDTVSSVLEQWGIPHDRPAPQGTFDEMLEHLHEYPLVVVVGYLVDDYLSPHRQTALEQYASAGGTLVIVNPVFALDTAAHSLLGTRTIERRDDVEALRFEDGPHAVTAGFDSPEERLIPLDNRFSPDASRFVNVLIPDENKAHTLASALVEGNPVGALLTQRIVGRGLVYALGHQLVRFHHGRCYINCFEPSGDTFGLFVREVFREATRGHVVLKHTVAGPEDSLLLLTHDVDSYDAQHAGEWGRPGALRVAELEERHGARGSFFVTTGDAAGPLSDDLMQTLCARGVCPLGAHSVLHGNDFATLPLGTCQEMPEAYAPETMPSLCGEVRASIARLERVTGQRPLTWRSPFLLVHPHQYEVLEQEGVVYDSSYAVGDLKFNLPLSLARTGIFQHVFKGRNLYTMPITLEDGIAEEVDGETVRQELSAENLQRFTTIWVNTLLRNADNGAHTMTLMHPSYGWGVPVTNLDNKLRVLEAVLKTAELRHVKADLGVEALAEFWRARESTRLEARYDAGVYIGTLATGPASAPHFTLEFGDSIRSFECATCGDFDVFGDRVVFRAALAPETTHEFRAEAGVAK